MESLARLYVEAAAMSVLYRLLDKDPFQSGFAGNLLACFAVFLRSRDICSRSQNQLKIHQQSRQVNTGTNMKTADDIKKRPPDKNNAGSGFIGLITGSLLLGSLIRFADYFNAKLAESMIGTAFSSYDSSLKRLSGYYEKIGSAQIRLIGRIKRFFLNGFSGSFILNAFSNSHSAMLAMPMRSWGIGFLSAGLYTAAIWMLKHFVLFSDTRLIDLLIGAAAILISLLFFASGNTLSAEICSSRIAGFFLFRFLGLRRDDIQTDEVDSSRGASAAALVAGTAIGILTYFISPIYILRDRRAYGSLTRIHRKADYNYFACSFFPTMALLIKLVCIVLIEAVKRKKNA